MRAVIQAVSSASVRVNGGDPRAIGPGLVILLVLWTKGFRRSRRYGSRSGRRYRSSSYRGGRRGR